MDIIVPVASPETIQVSPPAPQSQVIVNNVGVKGDPGVDGAPGATGPTGIQGPPGALASYYDVKDYGAVGDGSTDDTATVVSAITAAHLDGGGTVFFPTGNYLISDSLNCNTGVSFAGVGSEASIITQSDNTKPVFVGTDIASISIEALLLQGPSSGSASGIDFGWSSAGNLPFLHFTDLWVRDFGASGIALQTPIVSHFDRVIVQDNGTHGFDLYEAGTSCVFTSCWARGNAQAGYHFFESVYMNLAGCAADNNGIGYLVESAQSISFDACGAEGQLTNGGSYDGIGFKIANSSVININSAWITDNRNIGIWITDGSQEVKINAADNTPNGTAVAFIKTDVSTNSTIYELHNSTANDLAAGTVNILNDGALGIQVKSFKVKDASGTLSVTAATDGGDYNLSADTTGVLAIYGAGGQTLNVNLLDGYLQLSALTLSTVPYLDSNKRFASSAVTPTELGYLSGVSSGIQAQINAISGSEVTASNTITFTNKTYDTAGTGNVFKINGTGISAVTGTGAVVLASSPTLTTPALGTPSALVLTNATGTPSSIGLANGTGLPVSTGISGFGTGIATALAVNTGSAGAPVLFNGAGGTPSSLTLTNATGLPVGSLTGLGSGVGTWLATPSSANLATAMTDESGTGVLTFGTDPTITINGGTGAINAIGQTAISFKDNTDSTKIMQFLMSGITTGTTRTLTVPNSSSTIALLGLAQSFSAVQTFTVAPLVTLNNAATNTEVVTLTLTTNSTGTGATGLGSQLKFAMETSTTNTQDAAAVSAVWTDATHATRTAALKIYTVNSAAALTEVARFTNTGLTLGVATTKLGVLTLSGSTSGTTLLQPNVTASGTLTLPAATDTLIGKATTDTLTNKTFDTAGAGNSFSINGVAATANTGTGAVARAAGPTFTTPTLGAATATSLNSLTISTSTGTFTLTNGKTLSVTNTLTLSGTDGTTMTLPSTSATIARTDAANTFTGHQTIEGITSTGATGTGKFVFDASPTVSSLTVNTLLTANTQISLVGASGTLVFTAASDGGDYNIFSANGTQVLAVYGSGGNTLSLNLLDGNLRLNSVDRITNQGVFFPYAVATASAPTYVKGGMYFDTTLNKMRIGGASAWETVTSV